MAVVGVGNKTADYDEQDLGGLESLANLTWDIVIRKQAEEALLRSEEKYRDLMEHANSIIIRMNTDGIVTFFNEFAEHFFGYAKDEIIGKNVVGTIVPDRDMDGRDMPNMIHDLLKFPEKYALNENENQRKDGSRVWINWDQQSGYQ